MQHDRLGAIERRLIDLETSNAVNAVHQVNVGERLSSIEDTLKWLVRLVVGGMILAVISVTLEGHIPL
ncbi:pseudouridine synthase [Salipiger sp. IMCC34102]|uniref:hemolysin XhlA family protein n=1 Tax=Salipiger sp. IMCC34102 TaxID=2510647 RepID=UPI00101D43AB|nr:hemolysin XhlA family protein [Salipiger sp. IMCC34102]RYH03016.1 pseudouridine synthase [Salipiger sp. IMCC34102]